MAETVPDNDKPKYDHPGQPTLYKPEYCQQLIDHMAKGFSFGSFAAMVDVCEDTLYSWKEKNPEFSESEKLGSAKSKLIWEGFGIDGTINRIPFFNDRSWKFNMMNRFNWRDSQDVKHSGDIGGKHELTINIVAAKDKEGKDA